MSLPYSNRVLQVIKGIQICVGGKIIQYGPHERISFYVVCMIEHSVGFWLIEPSDTEVSVVKVFCLSVPLYTCSPSDALIMDRKKVILSQKHKTHTIVFIIQGCIKQTKFKVSSMVFNKDSQSVYVVQSSTNLHSQHWSMDNMQGWADFGEKAASKAQFGLLLQLRMFSFEDISYELVK